VSLIKDIGKVVQQTTSNALTVAKTNVVKQSTTQQQKIEVTPKPNRKTLVSHPIDKILKDPKKWN